jgi:sulfur transfer protein SufE/stress-induced morphogen
MRSSLSFRPLAALVVLFLGHLPTTQTPRLFRDASSSSASASTDIAELHLTDELEKLVTAFCSINDDQRRYKQLLYMANQLPPLDDAWRVPENIVPGCLSTVYIHAYCEKNKIYFCGDSDGLLTKGLVAFLIRGLNGTCSDEICHVDPKFIQVAGISASLTPGRNNGFLNMLAVIQQKAKQLSASASGGASDGDESSSSNEKGVDADQVDDSAAATTSKTPKYDAIIQALSQLKPSKLELTDNSHQHAGHAGNNMDGESHFDVHIVAEAFDGLSLVKRHQLVYLLLRDVMPQIHALQIRAQTPREAEL